MNRTELAAALRHLRSIEDAIEAYGAECGNKGIEYDNREKIAAAKKALWEAINEKQ